MQRIYVLRQHATENRVDILAEGIIHVTGHVTLSVRQDVDESVLPGSAKWEAPPLSFPDLPALNVFAQSIKGSIFELDLGGQAFDALEGLCVMCLGGPFPTRDGVPGYGHHCFECGASSSNVYLPQQAVSALRRKDKQRVEDHMEQRKELEYVKSLAPIPDSIQAKRTLPPEDLEALESWERSWPGYFVDLWEVSSTIAGRRGPRRVLVNCRAKTEEEARKRGALILPWPLPTVKTQGEADG